ncbi:MAG TPA: hypothetical protein VGM33_12695 [Baekduia sp.]|jgi:hypothetical protein
MPMVREAVRASVMANVIAALQSAVDVLAGIEDDVCAAEYQRHLDHWRGGKPEGDDDLRQVRHLSAVRGPDAEERTSA